uniref:Extended synaptotagmin-3-like n=1 Tax=Echeneis naucrates TaxID=173247 RepID=A0A665VAX9_ECHNA
NAEVIAAVGDRPPRFDPMAFTGRAHPGGPAEGAGLGGSSEQLSSSAVNRIIMEFVIYCGRAAFLCYPVYLTGYWGLSISWVLLCLVMVTWWRKNRQFKDHRIGTAIDFVDNEDTVINRELKSALQMASWVHFPDVEKVDWVNKVLQQAWPFFGMFMEKLLKENIQPAVRQSSPALKMFTFTKVHFGHIPPRITGMRAYTQEADQKEVILDMNICYDGDVDIDAEVNAPIVAGVKGLKLKGMLRVILEPLIGQVPLVGGVTIFFIRPPTLEINWTGMTNLLDSPAFSSLSEETIIDIISSLMVLPNRMCFPLIDQVKVDQMRFPLPRGVVRVHLLEAKDLLAKDTYMMGLVKGKSDPYAKLRVGNRNVKSKTIKESLDPKWNEVYEFVVHEAPGQELEVELYDEDTDKDDFLGVQNGEVHLKLQWFSLQADPSLLRQHAIYSQLKYVFFFFPLCIVVAQVIEHEKKSPLGSLNLPLSRLLSISNMTLDQRFQLERSGASSQIKLKATLRVGGSLGEIQLTVRYANLRRKLIVVINACRNLFPCSDNGTDSYVRLYLLPDQTWRHRKRTQVKRRTVNPVFNDKFEYDVSLEEAQTRKLDVSVKNNKMLITRERKDIGMVMIDLSQLDLAKGSTEW